MSDISKSYDKFCKERENRRLTCRKIKNAGLVLMVTFGLLYYISLIIGKFLMNSLGLSNDPSFIVHIVECLIVFGFGVVRDGSENS